MDLFLIIGLIVPIVGLFFAIFMIANVIIRKTRMNAAYIAPGKASYEIYITYLILLIILIVLGAGALSVDSVIGFLVRPIFISVHPGHKMLVG